MLRELFIWWLKWLSAVATVLVVLALAVCFGTALGVMWLYMGTYGGIR